MGGAGGGRCAGGRPQARRRSRRHGRSPCVSTQSKRPAAGGGGRVLAFGKGAAEGEGVGRGGGRDGAGGRPQARRRSRRHGRSPCVSTQSKRSAAGGGRVLAFGKGAAEREGLGRGGSRGWCKKGGCAGGRPQARRRSRRRGRSPRVSTQSKRPAAGGSAKPCPAWEKG